MPQARSLRSTPRSARKRVDWAAFFRTLRRRSRHARRALWRAPRWTRFVAGAIVVLVVWSVVNVAYQVIRKPTELFFPVSGTLTKPPAATWRQYGPLFREYSTSIVTPELLAALAQAESAGDPVARTYWRWRLSWNPLKLYQPASSAVGMYQMTDAAFAEARHYCVRNHNVVEDGPWYDSHGCWLNSTYTRIIPSHAIELTAIYLDRAVTSLTAGGRFAAATKPQKQDLAAIVHLCGAGPGEAFARRGFRLAPDERCGDHDAAAYLARVTAMKREFRRMAAAE
jgi:hypothetical protein